MKKVLCVMSDQFEELEATGTIALLRRAGITVDVCALHGNQARGRFNLCICDLISFANADAANYDALFLPGGPHYKELQEDDTVKQMIIAFAQQNKLISAICAAPTILGKMGLLKGKHYTCFTSMNEDFGGKYVDAYTAQDGNLITGRSAAAVIDFAFLIIENLLGKAKADEVKKSVYYDR